MTQGDGYREVRYDIYCKECRHEKKEGCEEPCDECLTEFTAFETDVPVKFEEKGYGRRRKKNA